MQKINRITALMLAILIAASSLVGCSPVNKEETRTVVDIMGAEVKIPQKVDEVLNLYSFGCQMMFGLGLEDYLIGISEDTFETEWLEVMSPDAKNIPTYSDEASVETLLAAKPDVVFCADPDYAENLRGKGVPCITFAYLTIDDLKFNVSLLGEILGDDAKEKCDLYIAYLDGKIADVEKAMADAVVEKENLHYINANSDKGFYKTAGSGSTTDYCAQLSYVELATASLIAFPESKVDAEALLATNPQNVIIGGRYQHVMYDDILKASEWQHISAVQNGNVFKVPMGLSAWNRYSLETALLIPWTASVVYPEHYEFDAVSETIGFYKTFMGYELTEDQAQYMIAGLTPDGEKEIASR
ncbi:MAG: ABC transporter substrate-binding protein [Lachnospiraceae bacterium]|nr:ABC transporter substrate-binding protein [Lachnospiraceae bacterium]